MKLLQYFLREYWIWIFNMYLCSSNQFKARKDKLNIITSPENLTFEDLRINKPEPTSFEIGDICRQMERQKFLLRPPYQRDEVIDKKKGICYN